MHSVIDVLPLCLSEDPSIGNSNFNETRMDQILLLLIDSWFLLPDNPFLCNREIYLDNNAPQRRKNMKKI